MTTLEDCGGTGEAVPFPCPVSRFVSAVPPGLTRSQAYPGVMIIHLMKYKEACFH